MHEMALCTEVVEHVLAVASEVNATSVTKVSMVVGETRDIIADLFDGFFHYLAKGTIAEDAVVSYTVVPLSVRCQDCGTTFPVDMRSPENVTCPACHSCNYQMVTGNEFLIESIDVVTPEEAEADCNEMRAS